MNIKKILIGSAGGLLVLGTAAAVLAVGTNGSFETGTAPGTFLTLTAPNNTDISDWTVDSGSVDYIGTYWPSSDGVRNLDMNGLAAGSISQTLTTVIGATYNVTFDLSGNPDGRPVDDPLWSPSLKVLRVSATGAAPQDYSYDTSVQGNSLSDMKWQAGNTYSFIATTTSTILTFASQIVGAFGPALDNVAIQEVLLSPSPSPSATPTPNPGDQCKKNGWKTLNDDQGHTFKNQGDCVSFFATNGKNLGAGPVL